MMKKTLLCLVATLLMSPVFADVHKWKDANGKTHYGDAPPIANTEKVRTDKQTDDQIANGERINSSQGAAIDPKCADLLDQLHDSPQTLEGVMKANAIRQEIKLRCSTKQDAARDPKCADLLDQLHDSPQTLEGVMKANAIRQEIKLRCMSSGDRQALDQERSNAQKQQQKTSSGNGSTTMCPNGSYVSSGPCTMCPDGSYVGGGEKCVMTPNGGYVGGSRSGNDSPRMTPNGGYVSGGSSMTQCPDGSYVSGSRCEMTPNGKYVGK